MIYSTKSSGGQCILKSDCTLELYYVGLEVLCVYTCTFNASEKRTITLLSKVKELP